MLVIRFKAKISGIKDLKRTLARCSRKRKPAENDIITFPAGRLFL